MNDVRIQTFPIAQLEYVFVPPGLPLVTKANAPATSSILVRGGAGVGKTTLAVALAHAIGLVQGGIALYLTTEFVATELAYKASTLKLPKNSIDTWDSATPHEPGAILAEHLLRTRSGAGDDSVTTVAARKRAAIDAVWELLAHDTDRISSERPFGAPVRVVVVDGFGLPEVEQEDQELRHELLALLQSLELVGITPIVVEEAGAHAEAWLPFIVDIVFEIELWLDPDLGHLVRRLKCPKSRYGRALLGPHDYGLESGLPALWPEFVLEGLDALLQPSHPCPAIFYPGNPGKSGYVVCPAGSILISEFDKLPVLLDAFHCTPGVRAAWVNCGPKNDVQLPDGRRIVVDERSGLFAIAWALLRQVHNDLFNAVVIQDFGFFLSRPRLRPRALRMIAMLSSVGLTVCIHGRSEEIAPAYSIADYIHSTKHKGNVYRELPSPQPFRADRWLAAFAKQDPTWAIPLDPMLLFHGNLSPTSAMAELPEKSSLGNANEILQTAITYHLMGHTMLPRQLMDHLPEGRTAAITRVSLYGFAGWGLLAARECLSWLHDPEFGEIWGELSAVYAGNPVVINELANQLPFMPLKQMQVLLRALARGGLFEQLTATIESCGARFAMPDWYRYRLLTESYLDMPDLGSWSLAAEGLGKLAEEGSIPDIHRAEIHYNLGVAMSRLGERAGANAAYRRALDLNPLLEPARDALS